MKQTHYPGRPRGRSTPASSDRYKQPQKRHNGEGREGGGSRGNPQQSVDRYLTLARDAASSGDPVTAENFYQYADHYYRIVAENRQMSLRQPLVQEAEAPRPLPESPAVPIKIRAPRLKTKQIEP